jgi:hypothetical protein
VPSQLELIRAQIVALKPDISDLIDRRDSGAQLLRVLNLNVVAVDVVTSDGGRVRELCGEYLHYRGRVHEALGLFLQLYDLHLAAQATAGRVHKGLALIWISFCFKTLGFDVHATRYAMLALCEDALRANGTVSPDGGAYFQLMWVRGMRETELNAYADSVFRFYQANQILGQYPEALLQQLGNDWISEAPAIAEALHYVVSPHYVEFLLKKADAADDNSLEDLAEYLVSCIAGCRCSKRKQTPSTEFDLLCSVEGTPTDFRSEWGRYFVCECKNSLKHKVDFTDFAKFCRMLDSVKAKFGIIFSQLGLEESARREQQKIFQERGTVLVVLDRADLKEVGRGRNLITLLRQRYESIRLDLLTE